MGLDPSQAGLICGLQFIGGLIGGPIWGLIADKSTKYQLVTKVICCLSIFTVCLQPVITVLAGDPAKNTCPLNMTVNSTTEKAREAEKQHYLIIILIVVTIIGSFFNNPTSVFTTSGIISLTKDQENEKSIGQQKFVGPAGFALSGFLSGLAIDYFPKWTISCYTGMFVVFVFFHVCLALSFHFLFKKRADCKKLSTLKEKQNFNKALKLILSSGETWLFLLIALIHGIINGLCLSYSFLYLKEMGASHSLMGFLMLVRGLSAAFIFYISEYIIRFLGGPIEGMVLSFFSWFIRCLGMYLIKNPSMAVGIDVMNGLTISLFVVCYMEYININYPKKIHTIICGIVVMVDNCAGSMISLIFGGRMYKRYGGKLLFLYSSITCLIWTFVILIYAWVDRRRRSRKLDEEEMNHNKNTTIKLNTLAGSLNKCFET